jgi:hypothetical protein
MPLAKLPYGTIYVWKNEKLIRACFIFGTTNRRQYIVINDNNRTYEEVNKRIEEWVESGWEIKVGYPPAPLNLVEKVVDAEIVEVKEKKS